MMERMMRKEVAIVLVMSVLLASSAYAIFTGTIEGYVYFLNGSLSGSGTDVSVSVASCTGLGCTDNIDTDANSYYVIANLNLLAGGTITATATNGGFTGSNTTTADAFQAAYANITMCEPPSVPTLTPAIDARDPNRTLFWTSGIDPNGFDTLDIFQFSSDPQIVNATSPQVVGNLSVGTSYTWRARTCNTFNGEGCCSAFASDTFSIVNNAPSAPTLVDEDNTDNLNITFEWTSGVDSDGDPTNDEFQLANDSSFSNIISSSTTAISPLTVTSGLFNTSFLFWRVRTCDNFSSCSSYVTDTFFIFTCADQVITLVGGGGGGGGGGGRTCPADVSQCTPGDSGCSGDGSSRLVCGNFDTDPSFEFGRVACEAGTRCQSGECLRLCSEEWMCGDWGECSFAGTQSRDCVDLNDCNTNIIAPVTQRTCIPGIDEAPLLLGVPPFIVPAPQFLTTPLIPVATLVLAIVLALLTLSLLFDKQIDQFVLKSELNHEKKLLSKRKIAKADAYNTKVVEPHMRKFSFKESKPAHRNLKKMYNEMNRDIAKYHSQLAKKVGEKGKASMFEKRAETYAKGVTKYSKKK